MITLKRSIKMKVFRHKIALLLVIGLWTLLLLVLWKLTSGPTPQPNLRSHSNHVLWWTSMPDNYESTRYCGVNLCTFTTQRNELNDVKAVLFYGSDLKIEDLPLPRRQQQVWALLHEESPRNVPFIQYANVLQHFNCTSTFSRHSDYPLTTHYLKAAADLTDPAYMVSVGAKSMLRRSSNLAPIAFLQSDCDTMSGRDDYVRELMEHIQIDSFGACLHNRELPKSLTKDYLNNLYSPDLYRFLARYKFILAYENGICDDYITEKFWRPLVIGAIPIYFGAPNIKDWEPNPKSVIHISDFASPRALAEYINLLDDNDTEYISYLDHKYEQIVPISNERLVRELHSRDYSMANENLFGAFECFVCSRLQEMQPEQAQMASLSHYHCPLPLVYPPLELGVSNDHVWKSVMAVGRCQAQVLDQVLQRNTNYTKREFDSAVNQLLHTNHCN